MKLFSLILFAVLLTGYNSYAQNTFPSTGNVGIGTTTPATTLNVQVSNLGLNIIGGFRNSNNGAGTGTTTAGTAVGIGFLNELNGNWWKAAIVHERTNSYGVGSLHFLVNNSIDNSTVTLNDAKMTILSSGKIGIGTTNPTDLLHVNGPIAVQAFGFLSSQRGDFNSYTNMFLGGGIKDNGDGSFSTRGDGGSNYFGAVRMDNAGGNVGAISFYTGPSTGGTGYNISNANIGNYLRMTIVNGNVGIGIANPQNKLDVNGTIHSKAVNIDLNGWNDYVFKKDYQLRPLSEVKAYIDQNQHLPEIPSEQEMVKKGLDVGEMNKLLMKKVEELTLYLIEKDQQVKEQQKINESLQQQIDRLANKSKK